MKPTTSMRKEVLFAIILGIILGGIIVVGIKVANDSSSALPNPSSPTPSLSSTENPGAPTPSNKPSLQITEPQDHSVLFETDLTLSGTAKPNTTVVIISENEENIVTASPNGTFSSPITLIGGENQITVSSLDENFASESASISVIYSSTKF